MKTFYIVLLFILNAPAARAVENTAIYNEANSFYQKGEFKKAIDAYSKIEASGEESSELYYNLANAYYKTGDMPSAILYYERALKLEPDDRDSKFNLKMANLKVVDKITPLPDLFLLQWWNDLILSFNPDAWAKFTIIFAVLISFFIACFVASKTVLWKRMNFLLISVAAVFLVVLFAISNAAKEKQISDVSAILFTGSAYVKSAPDDKSTDLFILHEGTKMKVIDQVGAWKRIRIADGNEGWLKENDLRVI